MAMGVSNRSSIDQVSIRILSLRKIKTHEILGFRSEMGGFGLIELVVVIAILVSLLAISLPLFLRLIEDAEVRRAQSLLIHAHKECRIKMARGQTDPSYTIPPNTSYFQFPDSGDDGKCLSPASGNILTAAQTPYGQLVANYALNINVVTGEKSADPGVPGWISWGDPERSFRARLVEAAERGILLEGQDKFYTRANSRYVVVSGQTWEQAQENSQSLGGNLVTIESEEENKWLATELYGRNKVSDLIVDKGAAFWIGLNDRDSEGDWQETSGETNEYRNWAPGEPDGRSSYKSDENYAIYLLFDSYNRDPGMWNDQPNDGQVQYGLAEIKISS